MRHRAQQHSKTQTEVILSSFVLLRQRQTEYATMALLSVMIKCSALNNAASHLHVDGFVLPMGQAMQFKRRQRNNINLLFSTKYDRDETTEKVGGLHSNELDPVEKLDMSTPAATEETIEGNSHETSSHAIIIQEGIAQKDELMLDDLLDIEDEMKISFVVTEHNVDDESDEEVVVERDQQRKNQKNPRMQMYAYLSQPVVEVRIIGLVLLSCFLQAFNTLENIPDEVHQGIDVVDTFFVYVFAIEFFLRWWSAGRFQLRYLAKPLVAIDSVVVILPLILSGLLPIWDFGVMAGFIPGVSLPGWLVSSSASSALLNLRLLRILKFQRVLTDQNTYTNFELALGMKQTDVKPYQLQLARVVISIFTLVSVSTGLIYTAEHDSNPLFTDYFTALYFGLTTLTTVGFGDITPITFQGRLVVMASILAGVIIIPAQAASLAEAYLDFQREREGKRRGNVGKKKNDVGFKQECTRCGAGFQRADASFCWSCGRLLNEN